MDYRRAQRFAHLIERHPRQPPHGEIDAHFIQQRMPQPERLQFLNQTAIAQMRLLLADDGVRRLRRRGHGE